MPFLKRLSGLIDGYGLSIATGSLNDPKKGLGFGWNA